MRVNQVIWDLDDDPRGNVQHILEHDLTPDEVEDVLYSVNEYFASASSGLPLVFGFTNTGKYIAVVFEVIEEATGTVYPVTAYETEF